MFSLCTRQSIFLFTTTINSSSSSSSSLCIFFSLFSLTLVHLPYAHIYIHNNVVDNDELRQDFLLSYILLFIRQKKKKKKWRRRKKTKKRRKKNMKTVVHQCSSHSRLVKCTVNSFFLTDTQPTIKFH